MYIIHTDENNYVTSLELNPNGVEVADEILSSPFIICYKYENGIFTFDNEKKARLEQEEVNRARIAELKSYLNETDYIYAKCTETGEDVNVIYADVIEKRKEARKEIQELEGGNA